MKMFNIFSRTTALISAFTLAGAISGSAVIAKMPSSVDQQAVDSYQMVAAGEQTIVEIASSSDSFETLTAALQAAGLVDALQGDGPFTVFAPTDEAFAALPEGTLEELLKPENKDQLIKILTYHVVPGAVKSTDLKDGKVATLEGSEVMIDLGQSVRVNNAQVVQADIHASNGVIHVIDKVILPPN